jgi:glycosyltransferase involved in cell wall biosynthesis
VKSIRILIVTHASLSAELGAGQMAINLAEAFRLQGNDVTLWSPQPLDPDTKWWQSIQEMRLKLDRFIETQKPFDLIDIPGIFITQKVSRSGFVVARSVQPDILYLPYSLSDGTVKSLKGIIKIPFHYLYSVYGIFLLLQGWYKSRYILCLGSLELKFMKKWFPWWKNKLFYYVNAISESDQKAIEQVRINRQQTSVNCIQFLWIGRWASHKGTNILLDFIIQWSVLRPQDKFTIAGCGIEAEKDCPTELLESGHLKIIPSFERKQLCSLLASHNVGLFTSKVEGWGLVLNEMLESGMLVFATLTGGVGDLQPFFKDMLKPFPPSLGEVANISTHLIPTDIENYCSTFSWKKIADDYINLISENL